MIVKNKIILALGVLTVIILYRLTLLRSQLQNKSGTSYLLQHSHPLPRIPSFTFHKQILADRKKLQIPGQVCNVPYLDPYHQDVFPHIRYLDVDLRCDLPSLTLSTIDEDGVLKIVNKTGVSVARFAYIQRNNDLGVSLSSWKTFYKAGSKEDGVKLKEDFVRVAIMKGHKLVTEYHMFPTRSESYPSKSHHTKQEQRDPSKLNIVMMMIDSLSHSSAQRYLNETYKMLKNDQDTVILNGHTIVGDGTTAQVCAILIGELEHNLPEARRGFKGSQTVDRWPFIYEELHKAGYKTLYTEDTPKFNTFNYRLNGFDKQPTTKYARPFWMAAQNHVDTLLSNSPLCAHEISMKYTKDFIKTYHDRPTFSFLSSHWLAHDMNFVSQLADRDCVEFFNFLEKNHQRDDTIVILFGDHGDRASNVRATMQGKLEERLPLMSFSFPRWFKTKYPTEFLNFKRNAHVLTSHFDIHATLRHLLTFPKNEYSHSRGKSLFTDVVSLNRTCSDVGIKEHWCSCLQFEILENDGPVALRVAKEVVKHLNGINEAVQGAKGKCETLKLQHIRRIRKLITNKKVQKFSQTFRDEKCDECGVKESSDKYKVSNIEIVFDVSPSNGVYETLVVLNEDTKNITVSNDISRLDMYGSQPDCVAKQFPYLRRFCYCKSKIW